MSRKAMSLVEVLVVLAIVGALVGLLLPAVQKAREASCRIQCAVRLQQVGLAIHAFHDCNNAFPNEDTTDKDSLLFVMLEPYLERKSDDPQAPVEEFLCPSRRGSWCGPKTDFASAMHNSIGGFSILGGRDANLGGAYRGMPIGGMWWNSASPEYNDAFRTLDPANPYGWYYWYVQWGLSPSELAIPHSLINGAPSFIPVKGGHYPSGYTLCWEGPDPTDPNPNAHSHYETEFYAALLLPPGMPSNLFSWFGIMFEEFPGICFTHKTPTKVMPSGPVPDYPGTPYFTPTPGDPAYYTDSSNANTLVLPSINTTTTGARDFFGTTLEEVTGRDGTGLTVLLSHKELHTSAYAGGDTNDVGFRVPNSPFDHQRGCDRVPPGRDSKAAKPGTTFGSAHTSGVPTLFADGSVRSIAYTVSGTTWLAMWTYGGNEKVKNID